MWVPNCAEDSLFFGGCTGFELAGETSWLDGHFEALDNRSSGTAKLKDSSSLTWEADKVSFPSSIPC